MKASICMATGNRPQLLRNTLESIYSQKVPFDFETIVVDNGVESSELLCAEFPVTWVRLEPTNGRATVAVSRNAAYRRATGDVIIAQSDDVIHTNPDTIVQLVTTLKTGTFVIATVVSVDKNGNVLYWYTTRSQHRALFFLGSLWRSDLYKVGGNDEEFVYCSEDSWFADCLIKGLQLSPIYLTSVIGHHQDHPRPDTSRRYDYRLYRKKRRNAQKTGLYVATGGPWAYG